MRKLIVGVLFNGLLVAQTQLSSPAIVNQPPQGGVPGQIQIQDGANTPATITFAAPTAFSSGSYVVTVPATIPAVGQVMQVSAVAGPNVTMIWGSAGSGCTVGGVDTSIIYNKANSCFGDANLKWLYTPRQLSINGDILPQTDDAGNVGLSTQGWTRFLGYELDLASQTPGTHTNVWRMFTNNTGLNAFTFNDPSGTTVLGLIEGSIPTYLWSVRGTFAPPLGNFDQDIGTDPANTGSLAKWRNGWFKGTMNANEYDIYHFNTDLTGHKVIDTNGQGIFNTVTICGIQSGTWCTSPGFNPFTIMDQVTGTVPIVGMTSRLASGAPGGGTVGNIQIFRSTGQRIAWGGTVQNNVGAGEWVAADNTGTVRTSMDAINGFFTNIGYFAGGSPGLNQTVTVAAPGGGTCTLVFTMGLKTGGTC